MMRSSTTTCTLVAVAIAALSIGCDADPAAEETTAPTPARIALDVPGMDVGIAGTADGEHRVTDVASGVGVGFRLRGASAVPARSRGDGSFVYDGALEGARVEQRPRPHGVEDLFHFESKPTEERVRYDVDVRLAAGLRHVGNVLEMLDARGVPRLRVAPPWLVDATGRVLAARLDVEGCTADRDPRSPIGRALTDKRSDACVVTIDWSESGAAYPLVLDPAWEGTGDMTIPRAGHTVTAIPGGAIAIGGAPIPTGSDLYDTASGMWMATAPLLHDREDHVAAALPDGSILVAAGTSTDTYAPVLEAERFDPATGMFEEMGALIKGRVLPQAATGAGGRVAIIGGVDWTYGENYDTGIVHADAEVFDPATKTWTPSSPNIPRLAGVAAPLADGRILVAGGTSVWQDPTLGPYPGTDLANATIFDPVLLTWSPAPELLQARSSASAVSMADGRVLVFGGFQDGFGAVHKTELFDPATGWTEAPDDTELDRLNAFSVRLPNGAVMVTGGCCTLRATEIFLDGAWQLVEKLDTARNGPRGALLENGKVLVTGGYDSGFVKLNTSELFGRLANGAQCASAVECGSAICTDGICCDDACDGSCMSCRSAETNDAEGSCRPVVSGELDPKFECVDTLANSCGTTGRCDGKGGCAQYPAGTTCAASACGDGAGQCDGEGHCSCPSPACSVDSRFYGQTDCTPYLCSSGACGTTCDTSAACAPGYVCDKTKHCVVASAPAPEPDGCGVSVAATSTGGVGALALCLSALGLSIHRRRATKRNVR